MKIEGWTYYNHAAIPTVYPHEMSDLAPIESGDIWKLGREENKKTYFARWTENWDIGHETNFWACILDKEFDIDKIKAKRRYEITKGNRYFYTAPVTHDKLPEMYDVYVESLKGYEKKQVPEEKESFVSGWEKSIDDPITLVLGAFDRETDRLCGFAFCLKHGKYIPISSFKTRVSEEKRNVNFALMYGICEYYREDLKRGAYLCDGWRNVLHDTEFQDWLIKYFEFRRAYCILHIKYKPWLKVIVNILYPVRKCFKRVKSVYGVLRMEEFVRADKGING